MRTIHKFPLQITASQAVVMPQGAEILAVQAQGQTPCLWALVDPERETEIRIIEIFGTGDPIIEGGKARSYLGTFQLKGGESVFHAFEYIRSTEPSSLMQT